MHMTVNKAPVGRNVDETLRILQGYQYVAANPDEVCPQTGPRRENNARGP